MAYKKILLISLLATCFIHSNLCAFSSDMQACIESWSRAAAQNASIALIEPAKPVEQENNATHNGINNITRNQHPSDNHRLTEQARAEEARVKNRPKVFVSDELTDKIEPLVVHMLFDGKKSPQSYALQIVNILTETKNERVQMSREAQKHIEYAITALTDCGNSTKYSLLTTGKKAWEKLKEDKIRNLLTPSLLKRIDAEELQGSNLVYRLLTS